jgi:hypothetical protein
VPEEAFELSDFLVSDVVPDLEHREMRPLTTFGTTMFAQARSDSAAPSPSHPDVDHIETLLLPNGAGSIENVNAPEPTWEFENSILGKVFSACSN